MTEGQIYNVYIEDLQPYACLYMFEIKWCTPIKMSRPQVLAPDSLKFQKQKSMAVLLSWHVYIK